MSPSSADESNSQTERPNLQSETAVDRLLPVTDNESPSTSESVRSKTGHDQKYRSTAGASAPPTLGHDTASQMSSDGLQSIDKTLQADLMADDIASEIISSAFTGSEIASSEITSNSDTPHILLDDDALRKDQQQRRSLTRDDSAYGIPSMVVIDGVAVDISGMDILVQVEMLRRAAAQKQQARIVRAGENATGSIHEEMQMMNFTELSDIVYEHCVLQMLNKG